MATLKHKGATLKLANIKLYRGGHWRPRFEPSPKLRAAGWKGFDFKDAAGGYLDTDALIPAALEQCARVNKWRAGEAVPQQPAVRPAVKQNTFGALFAAYEASFDFKKNRPDTRRNYSYSLAALQKELGRETPIAALDRPLANKLYDRLRRTGKTSTANHHIRVLKRCMRFGEDMGLCVGNPVQGVRLQGIAPRVRFLETEEVEAIVAAADRLGYHSVGDAVIAAVITAQRQGDVLRLPITLPLEIASASVRQGKRGKIVNIPRPLLDIMLPRMQAAARRAKNLCTVTPQRIMIYEGTARPYPNASAFGKIFNKVRKEAAKACPSVIGYEWMDGANGGMVPMTDEDGNDISKKCRATFADLRDTALTRMVLAECTISEVCAISGHNEDTALNVWKCYMALRPEMSQSAGQKVAKWCKQNGVSY